MGSAAYGELVSVDEHFVTYRFADDDRVKWDGTVVIPVDDVWKWQVTGSSERPFAAQAIVTKANRRFKDVGEWPRFVAFQS